MTACLDDNALLEVVTGALHGAALSRAEAHLDTCAACRLTVAASLRSSETRASPLTPLVTPGTHIGRYLVIERVGVGASGQVFAAYDPQLDRKVALKLLRPGASVEGQERRLAREAQTLARLSHPNVVTIFDVGLWAGQLFIALEFVAHGSAREWSRRQHRSWQETVSLYAQAGRGLAAAHAAGVVHRDFKPDNVLVRGDGRAQVTDFGLAGEVRELPSSETQAPPLDASLTGTGALLGTPGYMAPDQLEGTPADPSSDQYSFCVSLFEALTGERPFAATTVAELSATARAGLLPPTSAAVMPPRLRRVLQRGLAAHPQDRFPSMDSLVAALEAVTHRTRRVGLMLAGAGLLATAALALFAYGESSRVTQHPTCQLAHARHDAAWTAASRAAVEAVFRGSTRSYAPATLALVTSSLDQRHSAWLQQSDEACEAVLQGNPAPWFTAQLACLEANWLELSATVTVLRESDATVVDRAARLVDHLPPASSCLRREVTERYEKPSASDATTQAERALAARASALFELGQYDAVDALTRSDAGTRAPIVQLQRARAEQELGRLDDAERDFFDVGVSALARDEAVLAASAWAELAYLDGFLRADLKAGEKWATQALALTRGGALPEVHERVATVQGIIAARRGEHAQAERWFVEAEKLARERSGASSPASALALMRVGNAVLHQGRVDEALPKLEQAHALLVARVGEEHPDTFKALNSWGAGLGVAKRYEQATVVFRRALEGYRHVLGPDNPRIATPALNLGVASSRSGHHPEALAAYQLALDVVSRSVGPESADTAPALGGIGQVQLASGQPLEAKRSLQRALGVCQKTNSCDPFDMGAMHFSLAQAFKASGAPWRECEAEATRALTLYSATKDQSTEERLEVQAWLTSRGKSQVSQR